MDITSPEPPPGPAVPSAAGNLRRSPRSSPRTLAALDEHPPRPLVPTFLGEGLTKTGSTSRAPTPGTVAGTSRPMSSHGASFSDFDGSQLLGGPQVPRSPDFNRPLNVTDALSYLDAVKMQFQDKPDVYNHFLDIMKDFKSQVIDTPGVIERVSMLFHDNPYLIQGFNTFLPPGYRIEVSTDPRNLDTITVTTPMGIMTQNISAYGAPVRIARDPMLPAPPAMIPLPQQPPFSSAPPPVLPVGIGNGSRPATPSRLLSHPPEYGFSPSVMYSSPSTASQTNAAATFLGNMGNRQDTTLPGEFNHAIQFLNKIKVRYEDDSETYKQFLEILHAYQKEQKHLQDSQVYAQVQMLFKDAPDLMQEFRDFLPEAFGPSAQQVGLVGILPQPPNPSSPWGQADGPPSTSADKSTKAPSRRRKRVAEKEPAGGRVVKRAKPNQKPEPQSPKFAPFPVAASPPPNVPGHVVMPGPQPPQQGHPNFLNLYPPLPPTADPAVTSIAPREETWFFDRARRALEGGGTYEEFLKLLNLFARDIIDTKTLIERAEVFLDGELMRQFKEFIGWDDKVGHADHGPPGSVRVTESDPHIARSPDDGQGPSYRRLPESEIHLACSARGRLEWSVLNDVWVSHPTWASEDSGFVAHKKNSFEDIIYRGEEERHEYSVHLEALSRTITVLEALDARIEDMTPEERVQFRLKPGLGGSAPQVYERIFRKIYGRDNLKEVMKALQDCPSVSVPVVLRRLKQRDEEWHRAQREWGKSWREVDAKNFYKALDHQGIVFKANDKKSITAKHFVQDIESIKTAQEKAREFEAGPSWVRGSLGPQLDYEFGDIGILQDCLKLTFCFLDHSSAQYSVAERRSVERFLRAFIPVLFMLPAQEFNAACGPVEPGHEDDLAEDLAVSDGADDQTKSSRDRQGRRPQSAGVSAGDLRKRLLKTAQERSPRGSPQALSVKSGALTRSVSPAPSDGHPTSNKGKGSRLNQELDHDEPDFALPEDIWIQEAVMHSGVQAGAETVTRRPFFANTTFYTLLRLLQLLYSRLSMCKQIGAQNAAEKHSSLLANPAAVQLGLDEPNGPATVLAQAAEALGEARSGEEPNVLYLYLLDACEKVFDNELDQTTFEEHMRWFFGTKAYHLFTLDRVIIATVKQVQTIVGDNKCQELWYLLQRSRGAEAITAHDTIRYRREAEQHVGSDDNLYRFDWDAETQNLVVQLLGSTDPSTEEDKSPAGRWREYVATYVSEHPTEWVPAGRPKSRPLFLRRYVMRTLYSRPALAVMCMLTSARWTTYL
ncbi:uncharacterized protein B0H18DRAFT_970211 [Fomitopsis serialis]|uniref:uncharacterized protein n=1 Tax=Fomitopsis serialis TaxID=139415 RepID=UPI00200774C8|nr:uncharacterized protein B0H18DRAFT_970211 [Neoantrodia serialis]KAH9937360.1 hypothetical protein B0H18DRAFT_970211 [Neoantrodia serialis]